MPSVEICTVRLNLGEVGQAGLWYPWINILSFGYLKISSEIIRMAVMLYVRFPLSLRNVEDLLHGRGIGCAPK